ncbi:uncharacterized protein LOC115217545 [Octopus sinensis]|uniref:Uncharacterized protein LOC115217545 n=1 Tax=Octopus sinensis TaxID=2607531 RepID=A0A6P7SXN4_9MOLL|nr:uncharacterized protein LOC115217545 [Octopus sinensis]
MVLAILSACFFAIAGMTCFSIHSAWILYYGIYGLHVLFACAAFVMSVEFILAIVSSSICCCCPGTRVVQTTSNVVVMQSGQASTVPPVYIPQAYPQGNAMT